MLNLFCIILYITFGPNHWLEVHKCPYLQNSIQGRCWNTSRCWTDAETRKLLHNPRTHMLKHGAATQSEDAYTETRSSYMVRGCRCWNTELSLSSECICWDTVETATMLKHEPWQLAVKADTVKGRGSRGWTTRELRCWNNINSYVKKLLHQP